MVAIELTAEYSKFTAEYKKVMSTVDYQLIDIHIPTKPYVNKL